MVTVWTLSPALFIAGLRVDLIKGCTWSGFLTIFRSSFLLCFAWSVQGKRLRADRLYQPIRGNKFLYDFEFILDFLLRHLQLR